MPGAIRSSASSIATLAPGTATAVPEAADGLGCSLTADGNYHITVIDAAVGIESNLGFFVAWISLTGGQANSAPSPHAPDWFELYDPGT